MSDVPDRPRGLPEDPPAYNRYRARPKLLSGRGGDGLGDLRRAGDGGGSGRKPLTAWRVVRWLVLLAIAWVVLSVVVFLVSAQVSQTSIDGLKAGGTPPVSPTTVLILGSDRREAGSKEPGAQTTGPSRSDSILLVRVGGGHNGRLSIARDTLVSIPGHGLSKINAAYAYGGASLAVKTIERFTHIAINHVIEVDFARFPHLIDAMGGITYTSSCVVSKINGGFANGGYTLRLKPGKHRLNGKQALALSRTRKNLCNPRENDLTRARRQQAITTAMRKKLTGPLGLFGLPHGSFYRLPFVAWQAPKTLRSDMSGPTLAGVFAAMATAGTPKTRVLGTLSGQVPEAQVRARSRAFEKD